MIKREKKIYGVADKAWQCVVGCDPHMLCAPRCWARKTMARVVECQKPQSPERAALYQIALTPDGKQWSGAVFLDEAHLLDPLKWRKPALIATGFHGDWGRLSYGDKHRPFGVMALCPDHRFLTLTKQPAAIADYLSRDCTFPWVLQAMDRARRNRVGVTRSPWPLRNVSIGCSVMNQAEADRQRDAMAQLAAMGWNTHVWYEPAIGPVNWRGWEFLRGLICGFESGANSRPGHPIWAQNTRDWCVHHGIPFHFKQWGDWVEVDEHYDGFTHVHATDELPLPVGPRDAFVSVDGHVVRREKDMRAEVPYHWMHRVGKRTAGRLLDGREWNEVPRVA